MDKIIETLGNIGRLIATHLEKEFPDKEYSETNVHREKVHQLDMLSHNIFIQRLKSTGLINVLVSEESSIPLILDEEGIYDMYIDPLDGSSNLDVNVTVGSIFSMYKHRKRKPVGNE